jgi:hypothetical protein
MAERALLIDDCCNEMRVSQWAGMDSSYPMQFADFGNLLEK